MRANARAGEGLDRVREFLGHVAERGALPPRPCPVISNVTRAQKGLSLPVVDAFAARRKHIREVGRQAEYRPPQPSRLTQRVDRLFLHRVFGPALADSS